MSQIIQRCSWVKLNNPLYVRYHDREWGRPVRSDRKHFEHHVLEVAQAGLSWETVLNKRENYRQAFDSFDFNKIAKYSSRKINALLKNSGIIRNRLKIQATVTNAQAFIRIRKEFGTFNKYIWGFVNHQPVINRIRRLSDTPTKTKLSDQVSADLKKRGFKFVGSVTIYAHLQATGLVNDHNLNCFRHPCHLK